MKISMVVEMLLMTKMLTGAQEGEAMRIFGRKNFLSMNEHFDDLWRLWRILVSIYELLQKNATCYTAWSIQI